MALPVAVPNNQTILALMLHMIPLRGTLFVTQDVLVLDFVARALVLHGAAVLARGKHFADHRLPTLAKKHLIATVGRWCDLLLLD
jgi:hypothetical protein